MRDLRGKVAVVTGAASGIGLALAERFAREGMKLVLADVERGGLDAACDTLRGADVVAVPTDVSKADEVERLAAAAVERFGAVHVVCNNAGVATRGPCWAGALGDWHWVLGVNLWGVIHGVRAFVPRLIKQGTEAHIVNTASMAGLVTAPDLGIYSVTKHAVVALSECLHHDLARAGAPIGVSVVCPAWVQTRLADSERNRPAARRAAVTSDRAQADPNDEIRRLISTGTAPGEVADAVVVAILEKRFYVLTHPAFNRFVRARVDAMLEDRDPAGVPL